MIGTLKLVGPYVQPDQACDIEGRRALVPGFALEGREKPGPSLSGGLTNKVREEG